MHEGTLHFASDYMEGAHPLIMRRLAETNLEKTPGYGTDEYCAMARGKIRAACGCPDAAVHFFVGGTQTNATVIDGLLKSYQGVIAASTGHISVHEAGAIEFGGHKVLSLRGENGKISSESIDASLRDFHGDGNRDHMVQPGLVYISQPTEYGTLYSLEELAAISGVCRYHEIPLYVDGARLAYALACPGNTVTLPDLARLCDAFYIGGTKCGALFGEAVVIPNPRLIPHFFTIIKQHGALVAITIASSGCNSTRCSPTASTRASESPRSTRRTRSARRSIKRDTRSILARRRIRFSSSWKIASSRNSQKKSSPAFGKRRTTAIR